MLVKAIPKLMAKAGRLGLQKSLALHLAETEQHRVAIGAVAKQLALPLTDEEDPDLRSILDEGERTMSGAAAGDDLDAAIIEGAGAVESYEIEAYAPAARAAEDQGYAGIAKRLYLTLEEERQAKTKLAYMARHLIGSRTTTSLL